MMRVITILHSSLMYYIGGYDSTGWDIGIAFAFGDTSL